LRENTFIEAIYTFVRTRRIKIYNTVQKEKVEAKCSDPARFSVSFSCEI